MKKPAFKKIALPTLIFTLFSINGGAASEGETTCPADNFPDFALLFMQETAIQRAFTTDELEIWEIDDSGSGLPEYIVRSVPHDEVEFPIVSDPASQAQSGLVSSTDEIVEGAELKIELPDTGFIHRYHFRTEDGCWRLYRFYDDAM